MEIKNTRLTQANDRTLGGQMKIQGEIEAVEVLD